MCEVIKEGKHEYLDLGEDKKGTIILLHGLMGALSNFDGIIEGFKEEYRIVIPQLPIFTLPLINVGIKGLVKYVEEFIESKGFTDFHLLGNSLGGHLCQIYTMQNPGKVKSMTLTGSSGLFENAMGSSFPKRGSYEYIKQKAEDVFYNKEVATKELVDSVYADVNDRNRALRIIKTSKSAIRQNLGDRLGDIQTPTLLIWGREDSVTPLFVGEEFHKLIPNSELHVIDKCGHAPMMELPDQFNAILRSFLEKF